MAGLLPPDPVVAHALAGAAALVFLIGAAQKAREWPSFRAALAAYRLLPDALVAPVALALPALEFVAGIALLPPAWRGAGAVLAGALLALVTGAVAINVARGRTDIDCGCGGAEGRQRLSWALVPRNAVLLVAIAASAQTAAPRALGLLDYATVAFASLALYGLFACASQLLANQPGLVAARSRA